MLLDTMFGSDRVVWVRWRAPTRGGSRTRVEATEVKKKALVVTELVVEETSCVVSVTRLEESMLAPVCLATVVVQALGLQPLPVQLMVRIWVEVDSEVLM